MKQADFDRGAIAAASVADDYNSTSTHRYRLGDCVLSKLNVRKQPPRVNRSAQRNERDSWLSGFAVALAEIHRQLLHGNNSSGICATARAAGLTIATARAVGVSAFDLKEHPEHAHDSPEEILMLAFLDLETSGLDVARDDVLEVACLVIDDHLTEEVSRFHAIPRTDRQFHFDRGFMRRCMPNAEAELHHRQLDVTSVNELMRRFNPAVYEARPKPPQSAHRAMDDVLESLAVARHYAQYILETPTARQKEIERD